MHKTTTTTNATQSLKIDIYDMYRIHSDVSRHLSVCDIHWDLARTAYMAMYTSHWVVFRSLVTRANKWLAENAAHCDLFKCETVSWMSVDRQVFTDNGILTKSMSADKKTKIYIGLR